MDDQTDLRIYMLELSREVTDAQFNELKFVLLNHVPNGISDKMQKPYELFHRLEQVRKLTPQLLKKSFDAIGRQDLSDRVTENQHLLQLICKQENHTPQDVSHGYDGTVCDGPGEDSNQPRKLPEKLDAPIRAPYKSTEKTNSHGHEDKLICKEIYHQQPDADTQTEAPCPTTVMSMPEPQVTESFPDDVVIDGEGDQGTESADEHSASASKKNKPGTSTSPSEGAPNGSYDYEKAGARPKTSNPVTKSANTKGPSEQSDHVTTPKESGSLHCDGDNSSEFAASAPTASKYEKLPTGAVMAAPGVGVDNGKDASEGAADFVGDSGVHGSLHAHHEDVVVKSTMSFYQLCQVEAILSLGATGPGQHFGSSVGTPPPPPAAVAYDSPVHSIGQQQMTCYSKEGYLLRIPEGQHCSTADGAGVVVMKSGQQFCIEVQNNSDYACEVDVMFGGRYLGVWLVENGQNNTTVISGSAWEQGKLTFYSNTDNNAPSHHYAQEANGVIECAFAPEAIKLFVETMNKSSGRHEVVICTRATVEELVTKITEICGIGRISCLLYGNKELCRTSALAKYKPKFEDTIRVLTDEEDLVIECHGGDPITMPVNPHKTSVKDVMGYIQQKLQIPLDRQRLRHKGEKLAPERNVTGAFLDGEPVIKLEIADPIGIRVRQPSGDEKYQTTHTFATVKSLKKQLMDDKVLMDGAQLMFNESCLKDDSTACLAEYGIENDSVIEIKPPQTRNVHRGSGSRSFVLPSTKRSCESSSFSFLTCSASRGIHLGANPGGVAEQDECYTGINYGSHERTHGQLRGGPPDGYAEGKLLLTGDEEISKNVDDFNRKFEKKLAVTLKLKLVSNDVREIQFPSLPSSHESRPSPLPSSAQAPARSFGPTRTKVPPPVPE